MDKKYWNNYYQMNHQITEPSSFAQFCFKEYLPKGARIVELGSGNGRDAVYFSKKGFHVIAIDQSHNAKLLTQSKIEHDLISNLQFVESDFTNDTFESYKNIDVFYSRFTMHTITQKQQSKLLQNVFNKLCKGGLFLIEARTINDPLYGQGDGLSDHGFLTDHYRRFIEAQAFIRDCFSIGFELVYMIEKSGFSVVKNDNPVLLRLALRVS